MSELAFNLEPFHRSHGECGNLIENVQQQRITHFRLLFWCVRSVPECTARRIFYMMMVTLMEYGRAFCVRRIVEKKAFGTAVVGARTHQRRRCAVYARSRFHFLLLSNGTMSLAQRTTEGHIKNENPFRPKFTMDVCVHWNKLPLFIDLELIRIDIEAG